MSVPAEVLELLRPPKVETRIAIVGASQSPEKYGNIILRNLRRKGFTVVPVNPGLETVEGLRALLRSGKRLFRSTSSTSWSPRR